MAAIERRSKCGGNLEKEIGGKGRSRNVLPAKLYVEVFSNFEI
jgi:hypothetical protein